MAKTAITVPIFIPHAGCPGRCVFCNQARSAGASDELSREAIVRKVALYRESAQESVSRFEIAFFGGNFTGLPAPEQARLLDIASGLKGAGAIQAIRLSTRPDCISGEIAETLAAAGVDTVELGVQSFSDRVLDLSARGHTAGDSVRAVTLLRERGIGTIIQLMTGLPGDTPRGALESARRAVELSPSGARLFPAVVLRGSGLEALYRRGEYLPLGLDEAVDIVKDMFLAFDRARIPVIRMGLHPLRDERTDVVAGPYHPAFGFLVRSRATGEMMERAVAAWLASEGRGATHARLLVPAARAGEHIGHLRANILRIERSFAQVRFECALTPAGEFRVERALPARQSRAKRQ